MVTIALIGAGMRGTHAYGAYVLDHADKAQFVAVADPDQQTRQRFQKLHNIPEERCFQDWEDLLKQPRLADAVIISTPDSTHYKPTMAAIEKGYHILLEKPMSTDPIECIAMGEYAKQREQVFAVCHVLRYAAFFKNLKALLLSGRIGKLVSIQHNENVGYRHYAHSYVRGNWRNSDLSSPMILAKSCHDMDILLWLVDADCESVSSFGELSYFKEENAPNNAPLRCTDGCPVEAECPYSAQKHYLTDNLDWFTNTISIDSSLKAREKALKEGIYGRCVFHCDNNVVDHQVVNIEFKNGVTAAFTMCAFTKDTSRTIKLMGTLGEIRGHMEKNEIEISNFASGVTEFISVETIGGDVHGGGDAGLMEDFIRLVESGSTKSLTSADISVQSHLMSFAAEQSRLSKRVVNLNDFKANLSNP
ncbi:MAG: Gfo/Idh/MocA family protein [Anaerolineaceae bacterium]